MQKKSFVLLSGGLDSTTCLHKAIFDGIPEDCGLEFMYGDKTLIRQALKLAGSEDFRGHIEIPWVEAVSIDYNQRHRRELLFAKRTCDRLGIKHTILDVGSLLAGKEVLLSADSIGKMDMVHTSYDKIQGVSPSYVPFRNGLLLSAITAHAQKYANSQITARTNEMYHEDWQKSGGQQVRKEQTLKYDATVEAKDLCTIYYGAHAEDSANWAYPDCTPEFNGSMANAIYTGSYNTIRLATPLQWLEKNQIVTLGETVGVRWQDTWSCYSEHSTHCGQCPTCLARKEAFAKANVIDPTEYLV